MNQAAGGRSGASPSTSAVPRTGVLAILANANPLLYALIVLFLAVALLSDRFLTFTNQMNITRQAAVFLIIAVGQTFVISSRGIDLSVGSIVGFTGCVMATMLLAGVPVVAALGVEIGLGALAGLINGLVITRLDVNPLIATLGMLVALRGATHLYMSGDVVVRMPSEIRFLGQGDLLGVPMPAIIALVVALVGYWLLFHTRFGRYTQSIGSNEGAVELVGIPVRRQKVWIYVLQGVCCAIGAAVLIGRLNGASPEHGLNYELHIIAGVVLGGPRSMAGWARWSGPCSES